LRYGVAQLELNLFDCGVKVAKIGREIEPLLDEQVLNGFLNGAPRECPDRC
jgi:hypothetical protein